MNEEKEVSKVSLLLPAEPTVPFAEILTAVVPVGLLYIDEPALLDHISNSKAFPFLHGFC